MNSGESQDGGSWGSQKPETGSTREWGYTQEGIRVTSGRGNNINQEMEVANSAFYLGNNDYSA